MLPLPPPPSAPIRSAVIMVFALAVLFALVATIVILVARSDGSAPVWLWTL